MAQRRVLLIDDEDDIREIAQISLEVVGNWYVVTARSGEEGIDSAVEHQPDAILLDVMMPGMDGPTTLGCLRANPETRQIPVIFFTSRVFDSDAEWRKLDATAVIQKPFDPLRLPGQVASVLGWSAV
jgi:CheY-like chemotaxis protein